MLSSHVRAEGNERGEKLAKEVSHLTHQCSKVPQTHRPKQLIDLASLNK
jgi:hypothetical protein